MKEKMSKGINWITQATLLVLLAYYGWQGKEVGKEPHWMIAVLILLVIVNLLSWYIMYSQDLKDMGKRMHRIICQMLFLAIILWMAISGTTILAGGQSLIFVILIVGTAALSQYFQHREEQEELF